MTPTPADTKTSKTMTVPQMLARPLVTGVYTATDEFRAIKKHVAVCRNDDGGLITVVGPVGHPLGKPYAALFAAAPDMLKALKAFAALPSPYSACYELECKCVSCRFHLAQAEAREAIRLAESKG